MNCIWHSGRRSCRACRAAFRARGSKFPAATLTSPATSADTTYSLYTAQLTLSYVPDVFWRHAPRRRVGQIAGSIQPLAAGGDLLVVEQQRRGDRRAGGFAACADCRDLTRLLELQQELTQKLDGQRRIGAVSDLDVLSQQSLEAQTAQLLPLLQKQLGQTRDALTPCSAGYPPRSPPNNFPSGAAPACRAKCPCRFPSQLIEQRPDVRQAENLPYRIGLGGHRHQ